ncbi:tRNA dihydrouridine synthase DusB [Endozoicomonas numazuensis]|uniref:tRNA-dihydrouridine synthase B n=1 Tax=Endozoicomonas numazuensis TaxID=1137799 RepID=A0A081NKE9_9GAMM|nr:tRNA dihydrouridine synthase DusB [Endozoicomonas numazuensis]KEQ18922.1 tRNA-dihydrouridine synthase B [Endozoicomonas numazuensis]
MLKIGPYTIKNPVILAPMAGVTDRPFRQLCLKMGSGMAVSEMVTSNPKLWNTRKSRLRMDHHAEEFEPRSVQIAGSDPEQMGMAARLNQERGAQIIDINMGCPAKKVCNKAAGSALMREPELVERILKSVVQAVDIPVTLKTRTGWSPENRNGLDIALMAQDCGISALAVHGRTRQCMYKGDAEYETIARICESLEIPVIANGDITSPEKAKTVLELTGADAVMVGRAAQGRPWIFREINHYLKYGDHLPAPENKEIQSILLDHLSALHEFYGEVQGVRIARKHVGWYLQASPSGSKLRKLFNSLESAEEQENCILEYFQTLGHHKDIAA